MASQTQTTHGPAARVSKDTVAKKFVDMYYGILNNSHELMYRFYRAGSTVTVSEALENGTTVTETADTEERVRELVKSFFADITIKVDTTVPQFSMEGSVLILVSGTIQRMNDETHRTFSQAFLLAPQENGYYVLTDSMQIFGHTSNPILKNTTQGLHSQVASSEGIDGQDGQRLVPKTPRNQAGQGRIPGQLQSQAPGDLRDALSESPGHHHRISSFELQTHTPPVHEARIEPPVRSPSTTQAMTERQSYARALTQGPGAVHHNPGLAHSPRVLGSRNALAGSGPPDTNNQPFGSEPRVLSQRGTGSHRHHRSTTSDPRLLHPVHGHGVFIARLPFGTEAGEVVEVMSQFGNVVGGVDGIQVRDGRNGCYAFVSFETLEAAEAAIRGHVKFGGKQVFIERKYSTSDGQQAPGPSGLQHQGRVRGRGRQGPGSRRTGSIG